MGVLKGFFGCSYNKLLYTGEPDNLRRWLQRLIRRQMVTFKIEFCTGVLLESVTTKDVVYYHAWNTSDNNSDYLFDEPMHVRNWQNAQQVVSEVTLERILERARLKRPDSDWQVCLLKLNSDSRLLVNRPALAEVSSYM